jgi:hypothetical protein
MRMVFRTEQPLAPVMRAIRAVVQDVVPEERSSMLPCEEAFDLERKPAQLYIDQRAGGTDDFREGWKRPRASDNSFGSSKTAPDGAGLRLWDSGRGPQPGGSP